MPVPPKFPIKSTCPTCGWSVITHQRSDVIAQPSHCRFCENTHLTHEELSAVGTLVSGSISALKKMLPGR